MGDTRIYQWEVVLYHLATFGQLTALDAIGLYGITRLAAVVKQCERHGATITHERQTVYGKRWGGCSIAVYSMVADEQERQRLQHSSTFDLIAQKFAVRW